MPILSHFHPLFHTAGFVKSAIPGAPLPESRVQKRLVHAAAVCSNSCPRCRL